MIDKVGETDWVEIRTIGVEDVGPLRRTVLHPNKQISDLVTDTDRDALSCHFGAFRGAGLIGVCSVTPEAFHIDDRQYPWRLRGMCVLEADRGSGIGKRLLLAAIGHVDQSPEAGLWCNGRMDALKFYNSMGFHRTGATTLGPDGVERVKLYRP
jgi:predicted GNAT family N-acyltransferase